MTLLLTMLAFRRPLQVKVTERGLVRFINFANPDDGRRFLTNFHHRRRSGCPPKMDYVVTKWEQAVYISAATYADAVFIPRSQERLNGITGDSDRVTQLRESLPGPNDPLRYVVRPLPGEEFVVYNTPAAEMLGLDVADSPPHPRPDVFASVGRYTLCLTHGLRMDGTENRQGRIVVFVNR